MAYRPARRPRGYGTGSYQFAELEDTNTFRRSPGATPWNHGSIPLPQDAYLPQWAPGFGPGTPAPSPWNSWNQTLPPDTYVPQWAPPFGSTPAPWQNYGFPPPASPVFAPLEDTNRVPRPSDLIAGQTGQSPFLAPRSPFLAPMGWADGLPPLMDAGFGSPQFGLPVVYGEPITPMPMNSPFQIPSNFSPFPMPGTPGRDIQPILFAKKYRYESENLAARPSNWRHDYLPPRRFRFTSRLRLGADKIKINLEHCHLSPLLLMPNSKMPVMSFDLRSDHPFDPLNLELLTTAGRPFNSTDLAQLATTRPVRRLRFYHPRLPWYIDVCASQPNGVLVGDVLHQIHEKLHRLIRPEDFSNTVLDATDRELITNAYRARCDDRVDIMQQGVRRVDFMGSDVILQGFIEGRNGMWLMKTIRFNRNMDG